jgi:signal transduction histidine kinase
MAYTKQIRDLERRSWQLWAMTLTILLSLAVFIILVYFYWATPEGGGRDVDGYNKLVFLLGFTALVLLFCGYMVLKEMEIKKIRLTLIEGQIQLETLSRRFKEVESLFKVSTMVNLQLDASAILNTITETAVKCLDADQSSLLLADETKQVFKCKAAYGLGHERILDKEIKLKEGVAGYVAAKGESLLLNGKIDGSRFKNLTEKDINIASALCAPLKVSTKIIGVLAVNRIERKEEFTENDLKLLSIFADNAAVAIDKAALHQKLQAHIKSLKQANKELKETRARLIESEKLAATGEATAHIAHRILNPLTTIISGIQLIQLARDGEDETDRDVTYLKRIQGEAERIKTIIRGILTYSKPNTMDKKRTDLNELLEETLGRVGYISSRHGVDIHKHLSPDLPKVMVDELQLKEAFVNVMMNSLDAMRYGGNLTISTSVRSSGLKSHTDLIEASVTDTGTGISEENLDKVFQPFFTTKNPQDGTGLGLATTYGIIRNHDGKIDITSKYGHGTTVTVYLHAG